MNDKSHSIVRTLCATLMCIACALQPSLLAQFRPTYLHGSIRDVSASVHGTYVALDIYQQSVSMGGRDSGFVNGLQVVRISNARIDTLANYVPSYDRYASWGAYLSGLHVLNDTVYAILVNTSDIGIESVSVLRIDNTPQMFQGSLATWECESWGGSTEDIMLCSDLTTMLVEGGGLVECNTVSRSRGTTYLMKFIDFAAEASRELLRDSAGQYVIVEDCNPLQQTILNTPGYNAGERVWLRFGAAGYIEGISNTGRGIYTTDRGLSWHTSTQFPSFRSDRIYQYHHTIDDFDVVVETSGNNNDSLREALVYIMKSTDASWTMQPLQASSRIVRIDGDSLHRLCLSFKGFSSVAKGINPQPIVWRYDHTVAVPQSPFQDLKPTNRIYTLSAAITQLEPEKKWTLYSFLGAVVAQYPQVIDSNGLGKGLYVLVQNEKVRWVYQWD